MAHAARRLAGAAAAGTTLGAALMVGASVASAAAHPPADPTSHRASCTGTGCDNKDPVRTGCARGARPVASKNTGKGRFALYWSATCQTNWVQVNNYTGGGDYLKFRISDMDRPFYGHVFTASTRRGLHYGDMVWSPGRNCAEGHADWVANGRDEVVIKSSAC
jgi:hypothetical protein